MLRTGIVGLPNVGKSTLFNAIVRSRKAAAANYPFCTIEPNLGVVTVPDDRLEPLARIARAQAMVPTSIEFVDIAGLVKGASEGEGLGNKFLSHIREVDAIVEVVRCFEDADIHHVTGTIDPVRDMEILSTELLLADLESIRKRRERTARDVKRGEKHALVEDHVLARLEGHLDSGHAALTAPLAPEEKAIARSLFLLTAKPVILVANVKESDLAMAGDHPLVRQVRTHAARHAGRETVVLCAQVESDLIDLPPEEARQYLEELGVSESGMTQLIRATYRLLGLRTFFTMNEKEVHAWTIHAGETAPRAAGVVHTDFERGFIKAEAISSSELLQCGSIAAAREKGVYRIEGKDYVVKDGDVLLFKFNP
jgi:GTP-binding protein YchF